MRFEPKLDVKLNARQPAKLVVLLLAGLAFVGCSSDSKQATPSVPEVTAAAPTTSQDTTTSLASTATSTMHNEFVGGCEPFTIYAQNRFDPLGAAARTKPFPDEVFKLQHGYPGVDANGNPFELTVDGWVDTHEPPYRLNPAPFNKGVYYHVVQDALGISDELDVFVSYAGVRGEPTVPAADPTSTDRGMPAPLDPACEGIFQP